MKSLRIILLALLVASCMFVLCSCESDSDDPDSGLVGDTPSITVLFDYDYDSTAATYVYSATAVAYLFTPNSVALSINDTVMVQTGHPSPTMWTFKSVEFTPGLNYRLSITADNVTSTANATIANPAVITTIAPNPIDFNADATLSWTLSSDSTFVEQSIFIDKYYTTGITLQESQRIYIPELEDRSVVIPALTILPDMMPNSSVNVYHDSYWVKPSTDAKAYFVYVSTSNPKMIQANGVMAAPPTNTPIPNIDRSDIFAKIMKRYTR